LVHFLAAMAQRNGRVTPLCMTKKRESAMLSFLQESWTGTSVTKLRTEPTGLYVWQAG